mgnify:CR=1 FL=1
MTLAAFPPPAVHGGEGAAVHVFLVEEGDEGLGRLGRGLASTSADRRDEV